MGETAELAELNGREVRAVREDVAQRVGVDRSPGVLVFVTPAGVELALGPPAGFVRSLPCWEIPSDVLREWPQLVRRLRDELGLVEVSCPAKIPPVRTFVEGGVVVLPPARAQTVRGAA